MQRAQGMPEAGKSGSCQLLAASTPNLVRVCDNQDVLQVFLAQVVFAFAGGALAEGFEERLKEFQNFERRFEASQRRG